MDITSLIGSRVVLVLVGNTFPKGEGVVCLRPKIMIIRVMDEPRISEAHLFAKMFSRHLIIGVHKPEVDSMVGVIIIHRIFSKNDSAQKFIGEILISPHKSHHITPS